MPFRDNNNLYSDVNKIDVANGSGDGATFTGTAGADAFVIGTGTVGDAVLEGFGSNDSIITGKKIFDGNNDGYIAFGSNQTLDVDRTGGGERNKGADNITVLGTGNDLISEVRYLGVKDAGTATAADDLFVYADSGTRDALFGRFTSGFTSTNTAGSDSSITQALRIDNDVSNNTYSFGSTSVALLTDNALGLNFGGDVINGFGADDLLVFTSKLYNKNDGGTGDGANTLTFGKNLVLDLSGADGAQATDPNQGPGGQIDLNAPNQTSIYYLGEKSIDGTTYYYYGTSAAATPAGVSYGDA